MSLSITKKTDRSQKRIFRKNKQNIRFGKILEWELKQSAGDGFSSKQLIKKTTWRNVPHIWDKFLQRKKKDLPQIWVNKEVDLKCIIQKAHTNTKGRL